MQPGTSALSSAKPCSTLPGVGADAYCSTLDVRGCGCAGNDLFGIWYIESGQEEEKDLDVKSSQRTLGHLFKHAGYLTAFVGKSHLGGGLCATRPHPPPPPGVPSLLAPTMAASISFTTASHRPLGTDSP